MIETFHFDNFLQSIALLDGRCLRAVVLARRYLVEPDNAAFPPFAGTILVKLDTALLLGVQLTPGTTNFPMRLRNNLKTCGATVYVQALVLDPGAAGMVAFSPGLRFTVGN